MMKIKIKMMTIIRWHLVMMELMTLILLRSKFPKHYMTGRQDPHDIDNDRMKGYDNDK